MREQTIERVWMVVDATVMVAAVLSPWFWLLSR